jgi:hypothetical protein
VVLLVINECRDESHQVGNRVHGSSRNIIRIAAVGIRELENAFGVG